MEKKKLQPVWLTAVRVITLLFFAAMIVVGFIYFRDESVEDVLSYVPENLWLAAVFFIFLYALKSLTVVFPIPVLYISCGIIFPLPIALIVNSLGIITTVSVPYLIGRFTGKDMLDHLIEKYPKAKQIDILKRRNEWFFVYLVKLIGIVPCDISSMILGAMDIKYINMSTGSLVGMFPYMAAVTVLGVNLKDPFSAEFFISTGLVVVLAGLSTILYRKLVSNKD